MFSQFTGFLGLVRDHLDRHGIGYRYLDGRTRNRAEVLGAFKDGDDPVFLISLKAGGFGLNLTEADYCFLLDPWWNPAAEAQAIDRTHRIGQQRYGHGVPADRDGHDRGEGAAPWPSARPRCSAGSWTTATCSPQR